VADPIQFSNGPLPQAANTVLTSSIPASGAATPTVASAAFLPTVGPFLVVVDNERLEVASISGTTLTIAAAGRGLEGTGAAAHSAGAEVYQVLSVATLARHVDDRAAKGVVDFKQTTSNVVLSTAAGTYTDAVVSNPVSVVGGRRYRLMCSGGSNLLVAGSGFALTDVWQQRLQVDEGAGYADLPLDGPSYIFRLEALNSTRQPIPVKVGYYEPAADDTVTFRWQAAKTSGAAAVTSTLDTTAGDSPLTLVVEDVGVV
jgi:hypothetical protein